MKLFAELYLDEDVSVLLATLLRARGFAVTTAHAEGMLHRSDAEQLARRLGILLDTLSADEIQNQLLYI